MNSLSQQNGLTEKTYDDNLEKMFDNTNIYVLLECYYRETSSIHHGQFSIRLSSYLKKHGMIGKQSLEKVE